MFAATTSEITTYTHDTLNILTLVATGISVFFLIKAGYLYITSTGKPEALENAKRTIKHALIGLVIVLCANVIISIFTQALTPGANTASIDKIDLKPIQPASASGGLIQVIIDAMFGVIRMIVESATKPILSAILGFLTTTPSVLQNSVIMNFWLVILGITDALFVLIVALLGLQVMSASTFGFEELELKQLLPRIGIAFLGAHVSLFLAEYVITTCNALVKTVLDSTGGLNQAWIENSFTLPSIAAAPLITLIFMLLFVIVSIVLLLFYISRLIMIALGATLSPLIFLLWALPKTSDFAEIAVKTYFVTVFTVFIHVVTIQLAASFLTIPGQSGTNPLLSILVAVGLFFTLLKTPSLMMQFIFYNSGRGLFKKIGSQIINVIATHKNISERPQPYSRMPVKTPRRIVNA